MAVKAKKCKTKTKKAEPYENMDAVCNYSGGKCCGGGIIVCWPFECERDLSEGQLLE
ncbi:MAG: hypothetical protein ABSD57_03770 [Verrucomicrobiota bacterium]